MPAKNLNTFLLTGFIDLNTSDSLLGIVNGNLRRLNPGSISMLNLTAKTGVFSNLNGTTGVFSNLTGTTGVFSNLTAIENLKVGGTGVLLSGSTPFVINFSHTKNTPSVGDARAYFGRVSDIGPVSLGNNEKRRVQILQDCFLRRVSWSNIAATTVGSPTDAATGYFKNFGNNPLANDTTVGVQVTQAINTPLANTVYNYASGNLNIPIKSGDYVSFYYQSNFVTAPVAFAVSVDAYLYV